MKIIDILKNTDGGISFEFFPPKTEKGMENLRLAAQELQTLSPLYCSVTYGAGGTTREGTKNTIGLLNGIFGIPMMAHLTCIGASKENIASLLDEYAAAGHRNILALRGDLPEGMDVSMLSKDFRHAGDLVAFAKARGDFSVAVAVCPEGHPESPDLATDVARCAEKFSAGADFGVTQMFFDNDCFYRYVDLLRKRGVKNAVLPGILPIVDFPKACQFAALNKTTIPARVAARFEKASADLSETRKIGIEFATEQCRDLISHGYSHLHVFALNRADTVVDLVKGIRS